MKIGTIIQLVKAGYTPAEIREMDTEKAAKIIELSGSGIGKDQIAEILPMISEDDPQPENPIEQKKIPDPDDEAPDYKTMYENLLAQQQRQNARQDQSGEEKSLEDVLKEIVVDYM